MAVATSWGKATASGSWAKRLAQPPRDPLGLAAGAGGVRGGPHSLDGCSKVEPGNGESQKRTGALGLVKEPQTCSFLGSALDAPCWQAEWLS